MDWLVWFSLLLTYLKVTECAGKTESCLSQPDKKIWRHTAQSVVLKCTVSSHCSAKDLHYEWFMSKESFHLRLNLIGNSFKYSLDGASLHINSLLANDTGVYHCAAVSRGDPAPNAQHVGLGTTLVVRVPVKKLLRIILWLSFVLLAIYSVALVTLMVKKNGCNMGVCRRMCKTDKVVDNSKNTIKKAHFRDVLQEMYNRRNLDNKTASRNRSQAEAPNAEFNHSVDDIYQNV